MKSWWQVDTQANRNEKQEQSLIERAHGSYKCVAGVWRQWVSRSVRLETTSGITSHLQPKHGDSSASSLGGVLVTSLREAQLWAKASDMGEVGLQWRRPSRLSPECGHVFIIL